jgi:hypothetical protein
MIQKLHIKLNGQRPCKSYLGSVIGKALDRICKFIRLGCIIYFFGNHLERRLKKQEMK